MAPRKDVTDYMTRSGAQLIVDQITAFWKARGRRGIKAEAYQINHFEDFGVRSNIGQDGYPPIR